MSDSNNCVDANNLSAAEKKIYPPYIYFYYVDAERYPPRDKPNLTNGDYQVRVYFTENTNNEPIDNLMDTIINDADSGKLPLIGYNVQDIILRHPGYMLFAWREQGRTLEGIEFILDSDPSLKHHTFADFGKFDKPDFLSGVYYTNKRLNKSGRPLGSDSEWFKVEFITDPMILDIHNENTSNTGP